MQLEATERVVRIFEGAKCTIDLSFDMGIRFSINLVSKRLFVHNTEPSKRFLNADRILAWSQKHAYERPCKPS